MMLVRAQVSFETRALSGWSVGQMQALWPTAIGPMMALYLTFRIGRFMAFVLWFRDAVDGRVRSAESEEPRSPLAEQPGHGPLLDALPEQKPHSGTSVVGFAVVIRGRVPFRSMDPSR